MHGKVWRQRTPSSGQSARVASELNIPRLAADILLQRGLTDTKEIYDFLNPHLEQLPSPFLLKGMERAIDIIVKTIHKGQPLFIFGDYDVDGTTGCAVLSLFFEKIGSTSFCYQPQRLTDGYGLNKNTIHAISAYCQSKNIENPTLITVDCGISDHDAIREAKRLGFHIIVTDHHQPPENLPPADAIVNPLQRGCNFPFKYLAGVGVAFYLVMGLRSYLLKQGFFGDVLSEDIPNLKELLDLVALGTIGDVVPLVGVNRILAKAGLEIINCSSRKGIKKLLESANLSGRTVSAEDLGFQIVPRLNAPGRLADPALAFKLLISINDHEISTLAHEIEQINIQRKQLSEEIYIEAAREAEKSIAAGKKSIVLQHRGWNIGVLGIVAARLTNHFHRPAIVCQSTDTELKGSGRSIPGLDLFKLIVRSAEFLNSYGGHRGAVGITLSQSNFESFKEKFEKDVVETMVDEKITPVLWIDKYLESEEIFNDDFLSYYRKLQPFGEGNEEPVFATQNPVQISTATRVGMDSLRFSWKDSSGVTQGFGFGLWPVLQKISPKNAMIAFRIHFNTFGGKNCWEARALDFRAPE